MSDSLYRRPYFWTRLHANPLGKLIEEYVAHFHDLGYSWLTIRAHVQGLEHFGNWLRSNGLGATAISRELVRSFLYDHIPKCRCSAPAPRKFHQVRPALNHLLKLLLKNGALKEAASRSPFDEILDQYRSHLREVCGLSEATSKSRIGYARQFLVARFGRRHPKWRVIKPGNVTAFMTEYSKRYSPVSLQVVASSLRSFFRFLQVNSLCGTQLVAAVPRIANWKLSSLPKAMEKEQVKKILATFDRRTAVGRRNFAMALCQVVLGMRVSEVANLRLNDIDWRRGIIRIELSKSGRYRELPLPDRVGRAISQYLRQGRLPGKCRSVFVRHQGARGTAVAKSLIKGVMRMAYAKVPECVHLYGTHVLRHTAARSMLNRGANLKEVADVLGHISIDTTAIYAKVNLPELTAVALPWPEVQR